MTPNSVKASTKPGQAERWKAVIVHPDGAREVMSRPLYPNADAAKGRAEQVIKARRG